MIEEAQGSSPEDLRRAHSADVDQFYLALTTLLRHFQFRDRDRQTICSITVSQCYALDFIIREGRLTISEIGDRLALNKSNASRVVEGLESRGLTSRGFDAANHRVRWITATAEGERLHERIMLELKADYAEILAPYSSEFIAEASRLLLTIARRARQESKTRCQ